MFVCRQCAATFSEAGFCAHDGSPLEPRASDPLIGTQVGPYQIDSLIGVGGMGHVYKAVHPTIKSRVAVKVLSLIGADRPELVARFFDEARAVNVIRHESIVNILDLNYLPDGRPFIVMEFLDGQPLSGLIERGRPLPIGTVLRIFEEVLGALEAAHQKNIVHRDLKPDNIFISPNGRPTVLDFGIAKLAAEDSSMQRQTQAGSLLGTPAYMSPEQAMSQPADARSDLYALGVILYECLTGKPPFQADSLLALLHLHVQEPPPPPRSLRPSLSPSLEAVVLRALAKDPNDRWQHAGDMRLALQNEQHGLPDSEWEPVAQGGTHSGTSNRPSRPPSTARGQGEHVRRPAMSAPPPVVGHYERRSRGLLWAALAIGMLAAAGGMWLLQTQNTSNTGEGELASATVLSFDASAQATPPHEGSAVAELEEVTPPDAGLIVAQATDAMPSSAPEAPGKDKPRKHPAKKPRDRNVTKKPDSAPRVQTTSSQIPERDSVKTATPGNFDVIGYISKAHRRAKVAFDDAVLIRIDADGVKPNGNANLNLSGNFDVTYRFISPSRAKRPSDLPLGVDHKPLCMFYVSADASETDNYAVKGMSCARSKPLRRPRCSAKDIWQRAIADGAPKNNAVASLGYRKSSGVAKWYFDIKGVFSKAYDDDC